MHEKPLFTILDSVDSTNNYAMGQVQAALAEPGDAWYAKDQYKGKGQRGKSWLSPVGENLIMSIVVQPPALFTARPFLFNAGIANMCHSYLSTFIGNEAKIKWPNDLYWRDRKTGGILIENIYKGKKWEWAIIGIGININQMAFDETLTQATSLKLITGKMHDPEALARNLHADILKNMSNVNPKYLSPILEYYNQHLYKRNESCRLKKSNAIFETTIKGVNEFGQLITSDTLERSFEFGEVTLMV